MTVSIPCVSSPTEANSSDRGIGAAPSKGEQFTHMTFSLKTALLGLGSACLGAMALGSSAVAQDRPMNVLIIWGDDIGM